MDTTIVREKPPEVPAEKLRTAVCDGCGEHHIRRDLITVHEDNHDNLTYFHGDLLCRPCARRGGVSF